jgi:hypothetical protein
VTGKQNSEDSFIIAETLALTQLFKSHRIPTLRRANKMYKEIGFERVWTNSFEHVSVTVLEYLQKIIVARKLIEKVIANSNLDNKVQNIFKDLQSCLFSQAGVNQNFEKSGMRVETKKVQSLLKQLKDLETQKSHGFQNKSKIPRSQEIYNIRKLIEEIYGARSGISATIGLFVQDASTILESKKGFTSLLKKNLVRDVKTSKSSIQKSCVLHLDTRSDSQIVLDMVILDKVLFLQNFDSVLEKNPDGIFINKSRNERVEKLKKFKRLFTIKKRDL